MAHKWTGLLCGAIAIVGWCLASAASLSAQEAMLEFPIRPFNVDVMLRQQTFAPDDREIGVQLGLSRHTIADYVNQIYRKLNVSSRAEAAREAQRLGLFRRQ